MFGVDVVEVEFEDKSVFEGVKVGLLGDLVCGAEDALEVVEEDGLAALVDFAFVDEGE